MTSLSFEEQADALLACGAATDAARLREALRSAGVREWPDRSVVSPSREIMPVAQAAVSVKRAGRPVVLGHLEPGELERFEPIEGLVIPDAPAYVATDVDLGAASRNVTPEAIARNWGFSMAGSRCGDQRVPAFWVSEGRPKLGWCWDRNPHTWLGTASCAARRTRPG